MNYLELQELFRMQFFISNYHHVLVIKSLACLSDVYNNLSWASFNFLFSSSLFFKYWEMSEWSLFNTKAMLRDDLLGIDNSPFLISKFSSPWHFKHSNK